MVRSLCKEHARREDRRRIVRGMMVLHSLRSKLVSLIVKGKTLLLPDETEQFGRTVSPRSKRERRKEGHGVRLLGKSEWGYSSSRRCAKLVTALYSMYCIWFLSLNPKITAAKIANSKCRSCILPLQARSLQIQLAGSLCLFGKPTWTPSRG